MKTLLAVGFILLGGMQTWASDSDLFPLQRLEIGMTASNLLVAYPNVKTAFVKKNAAGQLAEGLALCEIENHVYWNSALIKIQDARVHSWSYVRTKDFGRASRNIGAIYKGLVQTLGDTTDQKVVFHLAKQGKVRSPMFVWKRGDALIAFTHSPVKNHKSGETFICQLTIFPDAKARKSLFDVATDTQDKDPELFLEVRSGNAKADK